MGTPRPLFSAQKGAQKTTKYQKIPRDGAAQERFRRKHDRGGHEAKTGGTTPLGIVRDRATGQVRQGGRIGQRDGGGRTDTKGDNPQGLTGTLATSREAKGGRPDGGRGGRNGLAAQERRVQ